MSLVEAQGWLADALLANGNLSAATRMREQLVAALDRLASPAAASVEYRQRLVYAQAMLASLYFMGDQPARAFPLFDASLATAERLMATEPDNVRWKTVAMNSRFQYAGALLRAGRASNAAPHVEAGCAIDETLLARNGEYTSWLSGARTCWTMRSRLSIARNQPGQAVRQAARAVAVAKKVESVDPVADRHELSEAYLVLGDAQRAAGDAAAAAGAWRTALAVLPRGARETPAEIDHRVSALQRAGRGAEAGDLAQKLERMGVRRTN